MTWFVMLLFALLFGGWISSLFEPTKVKGKSKKQDTLVLFMDDHFHSY
jgi:hypothetical protein